MSQALVVTVRFHEGRYHGTGGWPPAPARLFQALMAGAARGATVPQAALDALGRLEELPPPAIAAPRGFPGQPYAGFVPNNDLDAELSKGKTPDLDKAVAAIRVRKSIRPTLFDAGAPVLYCWSFDGESAWTVALREAVEGLYQLGRGIDMAWAKAAVMSADEAERRLLDHGGIVYLPSPDGGEGRDLLCPRPGSGRSLTARFDGMRNRFRTGGTNRKPVRVFVQPPKPLLTKVAYNAKPDRFVFDLREGGGKSGFASRRLNEAAELVTDVRDKAARRLCHAAPELSRDVERYLIGRGATETDKAARVRILPVPSVGHEHVDMAIRRVAVYAPQSCPLRAGDIAWAFAQVAWTDEDGVIVRELQTTDDDRMARRFERRGRRWRSVTPLALPTARRRRIEPARLADEKERKGARERIAEETRAAAAVRGALRHAGVRVPAVAVHVQREPFDSRGERAESFAAGTRFPKEALWHAMVTFAEPVAGPLFLGDGRYLGLGLMLPDEPPRDVIGFAIGGGLADDAEPLTVAHAARRAMMARVQAGLPRGKKPSIYVSGHNEDGSPADGGVHRHIAVVADLPRRRILYIAPNRLQRHGVEWREIAEDHGRAARALEGMDVLRAGKAGRLMLAPAALDAESDPLFAPARVWESVTDYHVTRHHRRLTDEEALKADILAELRRCDWPAPKAVEILAARRGPRGGLSGRLRLAFATARRGPLVIGRTAHKGGGLFKNNG